MAKVESGYDPRAVSPKGAIGVLQLIPFFVCQEYEVSPEMLFDPEVNIRIGLSYMKSLLKRFDENLELSLAAYNAGARRVVEAGYDIPPIEETQEYVKKVKEAMREGMSDFSMRPMDSRQNSATKEPS
jgi:soluble lytic murein transglycosylase-like protein